MILTEAEAKGKICEPLSNGQRLREPITHCLGSLCMAHWKWSDATHTEGYCSIDMNANDKPKIK